MITQRLPLHGGSCSGGQNDCHSTLFNGAAIRATMYLSTYYEGCLDRRITLRSEIESGEKRSLKMNATQSFQILFVCGWCFLHSQSVMPAIDVSSVRH